MKRLRMIFAPLLCGLILIATTFSLPACDVPVYRYALERWQPDFYQAFVIHRGALSKSEQATIEELRKTAANPTAPLNLEFHTVDLNQTPDPSIVKMWKSQKQETLPWVILTYPAVAARQGVAWAGPLDPQRLQSVVDSPLRREIARQLLVGNCIVWLFLESGDTGQDKAKAVELAGFLKKTEQALAPWTPAAADSSPSANTAPAESQLRVKFSVVRLARNDPAERDFIQLLLNSENELDTRHEPMVFPIYGQGRVLYGIVGRGINEDNVGQACLFLTGACSCEIKAQNPGTDLLFATDWARGLAKSMVVDDAPPELTSIAAAAAGNAPVAGAAGKNGASGNTATANDSPAKPSGSLGLNLALVLIAITGVVVVASVLMQRRITRDGPKP